MVGIFPRIPPPFCRFLSESLTHIFAKFAFLTHIFAKVADLWFLARVREAGSHVP